MARYMACAFTWYLLHTGIGPIWIGVYENIDFNMKHSDDIMKVGRSWKQFYRNERYNRTRVDPGNGIYVCNCAENFLKTMLPARPQMDAVWWKEFFVLQTKNCCNELTSMTICLTIRIAHMLRTRNRTGSHRSVGRSVMWKKRIYY